MDTLITINGTPVTPEDALGWAAFLDGPDLRDFVREQLAIAHAAKARGLEATAEEVAELFTEIRYAKRLESGEALRRWMSQTGLTPDQMSAACTQVVLRRKLRETITQEDVAGHYAEHRPDHDRAVLYRIAVPDQNVAQELRALVLEEDDSFCLLAMEHSTDEETAPMGGYLGAIGRGALAGQVEAAVFSAQKGDIVGPLKTDLGWELLLVHELWTWPLEDVAEEIRDLLFEDLVEAAKARVEVSLD